MTVRAHKARIDPRLRALLDKGVKPKIVMGKLGPISIQIGPYRLTRGKPLK